MRTAPTRSSSPSTRMTRSDRAAEGLELFGRSWARRPSRALRSCTREALPHADARARLPSTAMRIAPAFPCERSPERSSVHGDALPARAGSGGSRCTGVVLARADGSTVACRSLGDFRDAAQAPRRAHFPKDGPRKSGTVARVSRRVELTVGKQVLRLATTAPDEHLVELVSLVEEKLALTGGAQRTNVAEAALMAALALADELVAERGRRSHVEQRARETVIAAIAHVDEALAHVEAG